jgi:hypothetical protein
MDTRSSESFPPTARRDPRGAPLRDAVALFYDPKFAEGSHPTGEFLEQNMWDGGPDSKLATYVTLSEGQSHEFVRLP